jgi:hypothetical protein
MGDYLKYETGKAILLALTKTKSLSEGNAHKPSILGK